MILRKTSFHAFASTPLQCLCAVSCLCYAKAVEKARRILGEAIEKIAVGGREVLHSYWAR